MVYDIAHYNLFIQKPTAKQLAFDLYEFTLFH